MSSDREGLLSYHIPRVLMWAAAAVPLTCLGCLLLDPYPEASREAKLNVASVSNINRLGMGLMLYAVDYEVLPPADRWATAIQDYVNDRDSFFDPTLEPQGQFGYAFNEPMEKMNPDLVDLADRVPLIFQTEATKWNAFGSLNLLPGKPRGRGGQDIYCFADMTASDQPRTWPEPQVRLRP